MAIVQPYLVRRPSPCASGAHYAHLMQHARGMPNDGLLAQILVSQFAGISMLPHDLGLGAEAWRQLLARHFPGAEWTPAVDAIDLLPPPRRSDLVRLLLAHAPGADEDARDLAQVVATAWRGTQPLWSDLGLQARGELTRLMQENFPLLAAKNARDHHWNRFLYRQLCLQETDRSLRGPRCDACASLALCLGPAGD